jgi:hypothetical protein
MRRGTPPPFYELNEYDFQGLCRDLFEEEPGVSSCELYGKRGEMQSGVDLLARRGSGGGIEVGQCKCWRHFPPAEIRSAASAFLDHWEFWSEQQVRRFVLFVACDLHSTHQQDEISRQERAFAEKGIRFEAWSARRIAAKLKPHREIVMSYIEGDWVDRLCGPLTASSPPPSADHLSIVNEALVRQLESMTSLVSHGAAIELDAIRDAWREGRAAETFRRLEGLLGEPSLPVAARSELLVLAARAELERQGPDAARKLLAQLPAGVPSATRVAALIEYRASGSADRALPLLSPLEDLEARQLTAAILLETGRLDAAASVLRELCTADPANPETLRLSAFLHLLEGHPQQAQLAIAEALELAPRWASLRWAAGMIAYYHSVSPAILRLHLTPWPEPINWNFVRRDDTSATRLNEAAAHFRDLLETTDPPPDERRRLETWYLASLANNPERQMEAEAFCKNLLHEQPAHAFAVLWAVARRFDVDLKPPRRSLETLIKKRRQDYQQVLALVAIYLTHKQHRKALALIDGERPRFEKAHASRLWAYWWALALTSSKQDASSFLDELADAEGSFEARQARAVALQEQAEATGDPQPLLRHLTQSFDATSDPAFLFAACAVAAEHSDWAFVAERREALLELIGTPEALRLAAFAAYNTGQYQLCRELLDGQRDLFRHAKLPTDLRELRVVTARRLGALSDAVAEAEALARDEPSTQHLVNLADVYLHGADLKALGFTARKLLGRPDLEPQNALKIARLVYHEDVGLARALWQQATAGPMADSLVGEAFELASRLGLSREARPLLERLVQLARTRQAGVWAGGLPDLRQLVEDRRRHFEEVEKAYSRAAIPIHVVCAETGIALADFFHAVLADNERDPRPRTQGFLLIRHGGRPLGEFSEAPRWRLHLDVTAVLLAAHLDILDRVETTLGPLRVAEDLIPALLEMRDALAPAQPDHLAASETVLRLLDSGQLKLLGEVARPDDPGLADLPAMLGLEASELLAAAASANGAFVQFLPVTRHDGTQPVLPPSILARVSGPAAVLAGLRQAGAVPAELHQRAVSDLGPSEIENPGVPLAGTAMPLFCARGIAERLARLGVLEVACRALEMHLHPREAENVRKQLQAAERGGATAAWLTELIERIRQGIAGGSYEVVMAPEPPPDAPETPPSLRSHVLRCLQTLLLGQPAAGDVLWVDDRWANSYVARGETPIVGINEVLQALVVAGALRSEEHYAKLARMRAANLRFVPLAADELLHHLGQSQLDESGKVLETHELRTLRATVAATVEDFNMLQLPGPPETAQASPHELAAVINLNQAVREAIRRTWEADIPIALAAARSDWLIANLYYDHGVLAQFLPRSAVLDEVQSAGLELAAFMNEGLALRVAERGETLSRRREYFDWLERRLLAPRVYANPGVLVATAELLKRLLMDIRSEPREQGPQAAWNLLLAVFVRELPPELRIEIGNDQEFMASFGLTRTPVSMTGGHVFAPRDLFGAFAQVVNGRTAEITTLDSGLVARFEPAPGDAFALSVGEERVTIPLRGELLLLTDSVARRKELLDSHPEWFDCPLAEREAAVAAIATAEDLMVRVQTAESWKRRSAAHFYVDLRETLAEGGQVSPHQLTPPHLEGLLHHLRLERATSLPPDGLLAALDAGADRLVAEEGLEAAVKRLWSLPMPFPPSVLAALPTSAEGRSALLDSLSKDALAPLEKVHLIRIHLADARSAGLAESLTTSLLSPSGIHQLELFRRLLKWMHWQLELGDTVSWSPHARLLAAWLHADKVLHALLAARVDAEDMLRWFPASPAHLSPASFRISDHASRDAAHPDRVSLHRLVAAAITYGWEGREPVKALPEIRSRLQELISVESTSGLLPVPDLLRDLTMAQNGLGTFLNRDLGQGLRSIVDAGLAAHLESTALQQNLETEMQALDSQPDTPAWALVGAILGNLEPPSHLREMLGRALSRVSFSRLLEQELPVALTAIGAASQQARYFQQAVKDHLEQELVKVAAQAPSLEASARAPVANRLLLAVSNVTMAGETDLTRAAGDFAQQVLLLIDAWPGLGPLIAAGLREVCDRLSLSQQSKFARLLVRLRMT